MNDLVSVIMPSFQAEKFIAEAIHSVLAQTYQNWELVIVDDGSTDQTATVVSSFYDARIKYYKNTERKGAAFSRNFALQKAKGKWIAFLDSDDVWYPEKLEKQIAFMETNNFFFSYTNYEEIDEKSLPLGRVVSGPKKITKRGMLRYCWPGCLTVMYDAEAVGLIQIPDIQKNNDYAMWLQVSRKAECYLLSETLAKYRKHAGSISHHTVFTLVKWHYKLFREVEKKTVLKSLYRTFINIIFGMIKKIFFTKEAK